MDRVQAGAGVSGETERRAERGPIGVGIEIGILDQVDRLVLAGISGRKDRVEIVDGGEIGRGHRITVVGGGATAAESEIRPLLEPGPRREVVEANDARDGRSQRGGDLRIAHVREQRRAPRGDAMYLGPKRGGYWPAFPEKSMSMPFG
jgi:hypothetical protein